jgi:epoxyqueuosine reductase
MTGAGDACLAALRAFFSSRPDVLDWGIAPARATPRSDLLRSWIDEGRHAGMGYMAARLAERCDPKSFHPWAESAVVFAIPYARPLSPAASGYKVAAYAQGPDYHHLARAILSAVEAHLRADASTAHARFYGFVDTAPVFERDLASEAGLGWRAKNCCTLNRQAGSAFHLAGFFLDVALPPSAPIEDFCGGCTRCLDACPTGAFAGPGRLDANKCISYWTIEDKGALPADLADRFGGWIFGCDVCQEVCPWNRKRLAAPGASAPGAFPATGPEWAALLRKGGGFQSRFKGSPLTRAGRRSLLRNLAVAARNLRDTSMEEPLGALLPEEDDPAVRAEIERTLEALRGPEAG